MSTNTLMNGKKMKLPATGAKLQGIHRHEFQSMKEAVACMLSSLKMRGDLNAAECATVAQTYVPLMMTGAPERLPLILERAADLENEAMALDPRLATRSQWVRGSEGLDLDAALYAAGEENCCIDRRRRQASERPVSTEPVRIVISTDTSDITEAAAAAFIAAARLAAQFVPLEVWWQGSWIVDEGADKGKGHVFHVPLVRAGEMDFSRLQFVLCSTRRDAVSFQIMLGRAFPAGLSWGSDLIEYSALPETRDFVPASGIKATADSVASRAAAWAGLESLWMVEYEANKSGLQEAPGPETAPAYVAPTAEEQAASEKRWKEYEERQAAAKLEDAKRRQATLGF